MIKTIDEWADAVYELACEKGWHSTDKDKPIREMIAVYLINIHGEVSEAWEAYRAGKLLMPCDKADKMAEMGIDPLNCLEEELADIVIRVFDTAKALGIDIEKAINSKHLYNKSRSHRHGGKLA